ncbi:hypothetical protein ACFPYN_01905 [Paenisporosarcina macmurdoensis]|uniref:DUF1440 domain-containing protein n=1 Tax=Paenisporosarcina macmurdoensis TaxID=212659 RepID=A0ABW1L5N4_9BACL
MTTKHKIISTLYMGIASGILLGLLLKLVEFVSQIRVYTLLLNVDFIPFIGQIEWSEPIEFLFHVIVSICIAYVFIYLAELLHFKKSLLKLWLLSFILCLPTLGLYFILSVSAIKEVPAWNDWLAFTYWTIAHLIYAWVLPLLYLKTIKKEKY